MSTDSEASYAVSVMLATRNGLLSLDDASQCAGIVPLSPCNVTRYADSSTSSVSLVETFADAKALDVADDMRDAGSVTFSLFQAWLDADSVTLCTGEVTRDVMSMTLNAGRVMLPADSLTLSPGRMAVYVDSGSSTAHLAVLLVESGASSTDSATRDTGSVMFSADRVTLFACRASPDASNGVVDAGRAMRAASNLTTYA